MNAFALSMRIGVVGEPPAIPNRTILRREIERQIEALLSALDDMDGDPDREDDGTAEPSLGWTSTGATGSRDDREEDRQEDEPSLGSMDDCEDQTHWTGPHWSVPDLEEDRAHVD